METIGGHWRARQSVIQLAGSQGRQECLVIWNGNSWDYLEDHDCWGHFDTIWKHFGEFCAFGGHLGIICESFGGIWDLILEHSGAYWDHLGPLEVIGDLWELI